MGKANSDQRLLAAISTIIIVVMPSPEELKVSYASVYPCGACDWVGLGWLGRNRLPTVNS